MHRVTFSSLVPAATSRASVNGSCEGAFLAQAVRAALQDGPCSCARIRGVIVYAGLRLVMLVDGSGQNGAPWVCMHREYARYG
jgi:hypothetical protein